ncbi:hypothetical protein Tco_0607703 [Tanacetum coccineum]
MVPIGLDNLSLTKFLRRNVRQIITNVFAAHRRKMQKEKEQKDKLNAVKARLIYGEESGIKIRSREESHYSESKTPTARTEPEEGTEIEENYLHKQSTSRIRGDTSHQAKETENLRRLSWKDIMQKCLDLGRAPNAMRISGFMHGITHPGEVAAFSHGQRKASSSWKPSEGGNKPNFKKGFKNKQRPDRKPDRFSLLTKTPKEIFALEKGKFKAPPPMVTPVEKRDPNKYCEFHSDTGHSTDECMHLRKQIYEMIKAGKSVAIHHGIFKQNDKPESTEKRNVRKG